jgi:hypothetical protein
MIGCWSSWIYAIAGLKPQPNDTAATASPRGEVVVDLENALLGDKGPDNTVEQFWRYSARKGEAGWLRLHLRA